MTLEISHPVAAEVPPTEESYRLGLVQEQLNEMFDVSPVQIPWNRTAYDATGTITYQTHPTSFTDIFFIREVNRQPGPILMIANGRIWSPLAYLYPSSIDQPATLVAGQEANAPTDIVEVEEIVDHLYRGETLAPCRKLLSEENVELNQRVSELEAKIAALEDSLFFERDTLGFARLYGNAAALSRQRDRRRVIRGQISIYP